MNLSKTLTVIVLSMLIALLPAFVQSDMKTTIDEINDALKTGNTNKFLSFLADPVDITLPKTDDSFSKAQAEVILKKFFVENKVKSYAPKQSGKSVDNSVFIIGSYSTTGGKVFRSYVLIKTIGGKNLIQFVEFEEE